MKVFTYNSAIEAYAPGVSKHSDAWETTQKALLKEFPLQTTVNSVKYDTKTDRYVVRFGLNSAKATEAFAEFALVHIQGAAPEGMNRRPASWYLKMENGVINDAAVLYV